METIVKYTAYFKLWDPKTRPISLLLLHGPFPIWTCFADFGLTQYFEIGHWLIYPLAWSKICYLINLGKLFKDD